MTSTAINFVPSYEDGPPYQCQRCRKWYIKTRQNISCTVDHGGMCCHLYGLEVEPPEEELTWWDRLTSGIAAWMGWY